MKRTFMFLGVLCIIITILLPANTVLSLNTNIGIGKIPSEKAEIESQSIDIKSKSITDIEEKDVTKNFKTLSNNCINAPFSSSSWAKTYGGNYSDYASSIKQTLDGGFILSCDTVSFGAGGVDVLVMKLDSSGNIIWAKTYGGKEDESLTAANSFPPIQQATDGGFILSCDTASFGAGGMDVLVIKLDSTGNIVWAKTYGGNSDERISYVNKTKDGGLILCGDTTSFGAGSYDSFVMRLDPNGDVLWGKIYGGRGYDQGFSILQIENGFILGGTTYSFGAGEFDILIMKLDLNGGIVWTKTFGGKGGDYAFCIQSTADDGLVLAGGTYSFGSGGSDALVIKLDSTGNIVWAKTYGGKEGESTNYILQSSDGGFILCGSTTSFGGGGSDGLIMKLDSSGNIIWAKTFSGSNYERISSIELVIDGGFVISGMTNSFGVRDFDIIVMKLNANGCISDICNYLKDITTIITTRSVNLNVSNQNPQVSSTSLSISSPTLTVASPQIQTKTICQSVFPRVYGIPIDFRFKQDLSIDIKGREPDVRCLQIVLNLDPDTQIAEEGAGSPGNETTAFGQLTQDAVKRFQSKYNLPVSGKVDQATRLKLNAILNNIFTYEYKSTYNLLDEKERKSAIVKFVKEYKEKYLLADFPDELILAIVTQETGDYACWNNEIVVEDSGGTWGRGLMQVTTDTFVGAGGINSNSEDCLNARDRTKPKIYCSKYYSNTLEGIEANIKDGLYALGQKYRKICPKADNFFGGEKFTCTDIERILSMWGYNGFAIDKLTGEYTGNYLRDVADKLENLNKYFSNVNLMPDFVKKLRIANDNKKSIKLYSPCDIYVSDSKGEITGLFKGQVKEEIPNSTYDTINEAILILFPEDTYTFGVVGRNQGKYSLLFDNTDRGRFSVCSAKDIPINKNEVHQYTVDWNILAQGGEGVSLDIDLNGDGTFDKNIKSGKEVNITEPSQYTVFSSAGEGGTINPLGSILVNAGAVQTFIITTYPGYIIKDVKVDGSSIGVVSTYTFTNVTSNHTIEATFEKEVTEIVIILRIGSISFTVNDEIRYLDSPPVIKNNRTLLPIRAIVEALGGTVIWHESEKSVDIFLGKNHLILQISNPNAYVNGVQKFIDPSNLKVVPEIINSRTMLPLRFIAENLGCDVQWDDKTKTVTITYKGY